MAGSARLSDSPAVRRGVPEFLGTPRPERLPPAQPADQGDAGDGDGHRGRRPRRAGRTDRAGGGRRHRARRWRRACSAPGATDRCCWRCRSPSPPSSSTSSSSPAAETVLLRIGPITATAEGLAFALEILVRILAISGAVTLFYLTTRPADLVVDLERRGVSPRVAFVANASVQTVPAMVERAGQITAAQRARGLDTEGSVWRRHPRRLPIVGRSSSARSPRSRSARWRSRPAASRGPAAGRCSGGRPTRGAQAARALGAASLALVAAHRRPRRRVAGHDASPSSGVGYRYAGATRPRCSTSTSSCATARWSASSVRSEAGKTTLCLVVSGLAPRTVGGQIRGSDHARRRGRRRLADASAQPAHRHRLPEPGDPAVAGRRHRLRGGRLRADEPRAAARRGRRADLGGARRRLRIDGLAERDPRASPAASSSSSRSPACWPCARAPRPRRADGPARPGRHAAGGRRDRAPGGRGRLDPGGRAEDRSAGRDLLARGRAGRRRVAHRGPADDVLGRSAAGGAGCRARRRASGCGARAAAAGSTQHALAAALADG